MNDDTETYDLEAIEKARADQKSAAADLERQLDSDYFGVLQTFEGRRLIWNLLITAGFWRSSYTTRREDTDFREGERNVALRIWARVMNVSPVLALKMQEENNR